MDGLTVGRMVHFVVSPDIHRAAIVVNVQIADEGVCDLFVFSIPQDERGGFFMNIWTVYSETKEQDTWHWIEKA